MKHSELALGADIGGSHITAAIVNSAESRIISTSVTRISIRPDAPVDDLIKGWAGCIKTAIGYARIEKICLAMPGPFQYEEGICLIRDQNKYPGLFGINVKERLAKILDIDGRDIYLNNDAACFLHGEVSGNNHTGINKAIGVTLGTGLGTAIYTNGSAESADLWNLPFQNSIAEDYISSGWFTKQYQLQTGKNINGVKELSTLAETDPVASNLFQIFGSNLGAFLVKFINLEQPELIIIGGNIAQAFQYFSEALLTTVQKIHPSVQISRSTHGEHAALIGAVSSWYSSQQHSIAEKI